MKPTFLTSLLVAGLATFSGCADVPSQEIDTAKQAIDAAKNAQAPDYAPDAWRVASDAQARLEAELSAQEQRYALLRTYDATKQLAREVKDAADHAATQAATGKQQARDEAMKLMAQARDAMDRAQQNLAHAPRGKGTEADLVSLKADADAVGTTIQEMQAAFDSGDYVGAKIKAESVISAAQQVENDIERAKIMRRGEKRA